MYVWEKGKVMIDRGLNGEDRLAFNINIVELFYAFNYLSILIEMMLICSWKSRVLCCFLSWYRRYPFPCSRNKTALTSLSHCLIWCRVDGHYVVAQYNCRGRTAHLRRVVGNLIIITQHIASSSVKSSLLQSSFKSRCEQC